MRLDSLLQGSNIGSISCYNIAIYRISNFETIQHAIHICIWLSFIQSKPSDSKRSMNALSLKSTIAKHLPRDNVSHQHYCQHAILI